MTNYFTVFEESDNTVIAVAYDANTNKQIYRTRAYNNKGEASVDVAQHFSKQINDNRPIINKFNPPPPAPTRSPTYNEITPNIKAGGGGCSACGRR
jgi:hypothetical protein